MNSITNSAMPIIKILILNTLLSARSKGFSIKEIAEKLNISVQLASYHLLKLARENLITRMKTQEFVRNQAHIRFTLAPEGKGILDNLLIAIAGKGQVPEETEEVVDIDFQNLNTLFRQYTKAIKPLLPPTQWEFINFLQTAITEEIERLRQIMKIRIVGQSNRYNLHS